jgi:hypothetical protein
MHTRQAQIAGIPFVSNAKTERIFLDLIHPLVGPKQQIKILSPPGRLIMA